MRPKLEVADIFRRHGDRFRAAQGNRPPSINARSWPRSRPAGRRRSAVTSSAARTAARLASPTIPVATGTVRSVRACRASNGWPIAAPNCCPSPISMSSLLSPRRSRRSRFRTRRSSTTSCSRRRPRRSASSARTPNTSAPRPAWWRSCTHGGRPSPITRMFTASCRAAAWDRMGAGSRASLTSFFPSTCSRAAFVACSSDGCERRSTPAASPLSASLPG